MNTNSIEVKLIKDSIQTLIDKARVAEQRNSEEGLKYSLEALELAKKNNFTDLIAKANNRIGRYHWISGNFDKAIMIYGEALKLSNQVDDIYTKVECFLGLGNVYLSVGVLDQAVNYYNEGLNLSQDHNLVDFSAKIFNNLGTLYEDLKKYDIAIDYFRKSLEKTMIVQDEYVEGIANLNMANVHQALGEFDKSMKHIVKVIEYGKEQQQTLMLAHAYHSIGKLYQKKNDYDASVNYLLLGVEKALECKDVHILFQIDVELGNSYNSMDHFDDAEEFYLRALARAKEVSMDELMPLIYERMALFYEKYHMEKETLKYYKAYLSASKNVEEKRRLERLNSIEYQSKLTMSLEETKVYQELSEELKKSYESMHVLSKIGQSMTSSLKLNDILCQLYDNVNSLMNADGLYVGLIDPKEPVLHFDWNIEGGEKLEKFSIGTDNEKSWMVWSFLNKQTIKINNIEREYKKYIKARTNHSGQLMNSAMYSPLIVEGEIIGVFSIQAKHKDAFTDSHKDLMQTLSSYLAIAIKNASKTKQLAKLNDLLKSKSEHDGLTGIPNRRLFDETYNILWEESIKNNTKLSVLIIDIDNFKEFNDQYGHLVGDEVVKSVARLLEKQKRNDNDFVARYGGDEFVAILPNSKREDAIAFAEAFRSCLKTINIKLKIDIEVTVSVGIATAIATEKQSKQVPIYTADNQLYLSKADGKNRISSQDL